MRRRAYAFAALTVLIVVAGIALKYSLSGDRVSGRIDPANATLVAEGQIVYEQHCAACHGKYLEGQPNWRTRLLTGRLPAPPHDASGHTWHHPDSVLFDITKDGVQTHAPPGYESDMPAFGGTLTDADVWAVLSYIKSTWPKQIQQRHDLMNRRAKSQ